MKIFPAITLFLFAALTARGQPYEAGGMVVEVTVLADSVEMTLSAPTTGWLAVGIHHTKPLPGADLKMFRVRAGQGESDDRFVRGLGDYPPDVDLGGSASIRVVAAREGSGDTWLKVRFPLRTNDPYDRAFVKEKAHWITLAYSVSDDYQHHSRMRQQLALVW